MPRSFVLLQRSEDLLAFSAGLTPLLAVFAPLGLIVFLSITAIGAALMWIICYRSLPVPRPLLVFGLIFALWSGADVFWASDRFLAASLLQSVLLVGFGSMVLLGVATRVSDRGRIQVARFLLAGFAAALLWLSILASPTGYSAPTSSRRSAAREPPNGFL